MGLNTAQTKNRTFATILNSDGKIRVKVPEGTVGAVLREYEDRDGNKASKWEMVYNSIDGTIKDIRFEDGEYGQTIQIDLEDKDETITLSMPTDSGFAKDFMKRLPNVLIIDRVTLKPYSIESEEGKTNKGVMIYQNEQKVKNFFWDEESGMVTGGMPVVEDGKKYDKDDWKYFFAKVRKFLVQYTIDNIVPKIQDSMPEIKEEKSVEDDIDVDNIPF